MKDGHTQTIITVNDSTEIILLDQAEEAQLKEGAFVEVKATFLRYDSKNTRVRMRVHH